MLNRVVLVGRLTKDPNFNEGNVANARFTLAVNKPFKNKNGEQEADFINVVAFRSEKEKDAKFKLNTPYGRVSSRKGSKVIQVSNEQEVINQLEQRGFNDYVKVTKKLNQADIKKDFNIADNGALIDANGEVLEGASLIEKPTSYSVKVGD